jgi:hypothetical protein
MSGVGLRWGIANVAGWEGGTVLDDGECGGNGRDG